MFLKFCSTQEMRNYGGTAFIEIQYCILPAGTKEKNIVSHRSIVHWQLSSLYVFFDDIDDFYDEYNGVCISALHNDTTEGDIDLYGINYYNAEKTKNIIDKLNSVKPKEYETFLKWLNATPYGNGFYIFGI